MRHSPEQLCVNAVSFEYLVDVRPCVTQLAGKPRDTASLSAEFLADELSDMYWGWVGHGNEKCGGSPLALVRDDGVE